MSEPITWRSLKTNYRIRGSRCRDCGKIYFPPKSFCDYEGRKSRIEDIFFGEQIGKIYSGSVNREPTAKFEYLNSFLSIYVTFREKNNKILIAGRLTDLTPHTDEVTISSFIGEEVVPRFRRVYDDELIHYSRLQFSLLGDYYESHLSREPGILERKGESKKVGIVGYGSYIPKYRIKVDEVAKAHGKAGGIYTGAAKEKSVPFFDEDTRTFAVEAAERAIFHAGLNKGEIDVVAVGTESNPYVVYPIAATLVDSCGLDEYVNAYDVHFACKAATSQIDLMCGAIQSGIYRNALIVGSDDSQAKPRDPLDYSVGAGSAALVLGREKVIAVLEDSAHYSSDTPDFYRREGEKYPSHGQRFTGEQAYFKHITKAGEALMKKANLKPSDFDYFVTHQPNRKFPRSVARTLGFSSEQYELGNIVDYVGNLYAGSSVAGLCAVLDKAREEERILMVPYGSGAGSDAYSFIVTKEIENKRNRSITLDSQVFNTKREYVSYEFYRKAKDK
ncbi:MAG: hydroxymethylglutaryl-CoA synthase [Nitrososphaeria archaeon]|nr:hydroxymethylglutaryl-CoA synthase [Nitrososphaeria archaeon]NIQ33022.1 hydroxymethylglutaryl-CoA synthase [Nitrososphaeria archaeon]